MKYNSYMGKNIIRMLALTAVLMYPPGAYAGITLQECRDKARANYPLISRYDLIRTTVECNVRNASQAWLPRIEISAGGAWLSNVTHASDIEPMLGAIASFVDMSDYNEQPWQYQAGATLTQNIWDGGASALGRKTAKATAARDESELEVELYNLEKQVDEVFFSILLLEERLKQAKGRAQVLESNLKKMQTLYSEGTVTAMDIKSMEAEVITARQQIDLIENNVFSSRLSLSLLTSANLEEEQLVIPQEPLTATVQPEYALIESNRRLLELNLSRLNTELHPKIGLYADAYYGYPGRNLFKTLTDHSPNLNASVGIQLKFNLSALYSRSNDKAVISQQLHELDLQKDMLDFRTKLNESGVSQEIRFLRKAMADDDEILRLRTEIRIAAEEKLNNGVINASDLLSKINDESAAALQKSIHRIELLQALYRQTR